MPTGQRLAKQSESEAEQENSSNSTLEKAVVVVILVMVGDGEDSGRRLWPGVDLGYGEWTGQLMTMTMIWDNDGVILPMQWSDVSDM